MSRKTGDVLITFNFENASSQPLDAKTVVPNVSDLKDILNAYNGMVVFVREPAQSAGVYVLIDESNIAILPNGVVDEDYLTSVWKKIPYADAIDGGAF